MIRRPPRSTLFPYTTLFRSVRQPGILAAVSPSHAVRFFAEDVGRGFVVLGAVFLEEAHGVDRKSTRLNSSHSQISYAVFCLKKKKNRIKHTSMFQRVMSSCM